MTAIHRLPVTAFFLLAYAWTWLCWWSAYAVASGRISLPISRDTLATLGQFGPFAAAVIVTTIIGGRRGLAEFFRSFTRWRARPVWVLLSLLMMPALMLAAIYTHGAATGSLSSLQFRDTWSTLPAHFIYTLLLAGPLGEEPGWRGFALPRMQARFGPIAASLSLGLLWAFWHVPLWWLNPAPMPFLTYVPTVVCAAIFFTWLFNHTGGSVLYSLLFHASISTASVRLPDVPAHYVWLGCNIALVLIILYFDRRLGYAAGEPPSSVIVPTVPATIKTLRS